MTNKLFFVVFLLAVLASSSFAKNLSAEKYSSMKDPRDGQIYKIVKIASQTWMAENLNFETDVYHYWHEPNDYGGYVQGSYYDVPTSYCFEDNTSGCVKYGRLYTWNVAKNVCPTGWHLPDTTEWSTLFAAVGGKNVAAKKLKLKSGWFRRGNGTDSYGFSVLPASMRFDEGGYGKKKYETDGLISSFWSATENDSSGAYGVYFFYYKDKADVANDSKKIGSSVRCIKDEKNESVADVSSDAIATSIISAPDSLKPASPDLIGEFLDSRDGQTYKTVSIGSQIWMAQNLNYKTPNSYCYDDKAVNCSKYGRLYVRHTVENGETSYPKRGICPEGFHLPVKEEWKILMKSVGDSSFVGLRLKSKSGWFDEGNGSDAYGFSSLPGGFRFSNGTYSREGRYALFWNSLFLKYYDDGVEFVRDNEGLGVSVRCLKDVSKGTITDVRDGRTYKTVTIGSQTWMAENLNYKTANSFCDNGADSNCVKFGRQYSWADAMGIADSLKEKNPDCNFCKMPTLIYPIQGACPVGWHVPSVKDWNILIDATGGMSSASEMLKSKVGTGWKKCLYDDDSRFMEPRCEDAGGLDYYGFTALPTSEQETSFWSSFGNYRSVAKFMSLSSYRDRVDFDYGDKNLHLYVRCVKDDVQREGKTVALNHDVVSTMPSSNVQEPVGGEAFTDNRDGQTYRTVTIGKQTWMAENLNYKTGFSFCYDDDPNNCAKYGRLYLWGAAMEACPVDWHLPTKAEWRELFFVVGGVEQNNNVFLHAGKVLKSTKSWKNSKGEEGYYGTDDFGFSALAAGESFYYGTPGYGIEMMEEYKNMGNQTNFWTSSGDYRGAISVNLEKNSNDRAYVTSSSLLPAYSVRCIKGKPLEFPSVVSPSSVVKASFTDSRDGQIYKTVKIGKQTWMAQNLNYETEKSSCYEDNSSLCAKYGRLYTWESAMNACPLGWHVPDTTEWNTLFASVGGKDVASRKLKSTSGWKTCKNWPWANGNGTDDYGFSVIPVEGNGENHSHEGNMTAFWSSTRPNSTHGAYYMYFESEYSYGVYSNYNENHYKRSVRCVRDQ